MGCSAPNVAPEATVTKQEKENAKPVIANEAAPAPNP